MFDSALEVVKRLEVWLSGCRRAGRKRGLVDGKGEL